MKIETVVWQSKLFPKLILTQAHLDVLRYAYPSIKKFEPHLKAAEVWLFDHPERRPKKNWRSFISNWMRNAVRIEEERKLNHKPKYGDAATRTPNDPTALADILKRTKEK